jgi:hypothetical protein
MTILENKVKINIKNNIKMRTGLLCDGEGLMYRNVERHILGVSLCVCVCSVGSVCTIVCSREPEKNLKNLIISNV